MAAVIFIEMLLQIRIGKVLFLFLPSAFIGFIELYYNGHSIELLDAASYFIDAFTFSTKSTNYTNNFLPFKDEWII